MPSPNLNGSLYKNIFIIIICIYLCFFLYRGGHLITPFMYGHVIKIQRRQNGGIMVRNNVLFEN